MKFKISKTKVTKVHKKIAIILGTRPEIIKMSPVIRACQKKRIDFFILHTGQHYSKELDLDIFADLQLPPPKYNLSLGGLEYRKQLSSMVSHITKILLKEKPKVVIVQGDTNSVLAGALAANKLGILVAHHEAGLRSGDLTMPEEVNRIIVDQISDFLFVPTETALENLRTEGLKPSKIKLVGNTIVDAVKQNIAIAEKRSQILKDLNLTAKNYFLVTAHRAENVDIKNRLQNIILGLEKVGKKYSLPIIWPIHPRAQKQIKEFNIKLGGEIRVIPPCGFLDFLMLEGNAKAILTDSGGVQEEAFILNIPCITLRDNTERPETIEHGKNILAGTNPDTIEEATEEILKKFNKEINNIFGDGQTGEKIIKYLEQKLLNL